MTDAHYTCQKCNNQFKPKYQKKGVTPKYCSSKCSLASRMRDKDWFITNAKKAHGSKYDYSRVDYMGYDCKVCVICPTHGDFWQLPSNHLRGCGCSSCGKESKSRKLKYSNSDFKAKCLLVHGDKYTYENARYKSSGEKVLITCRKHGDFWQLPKSHLSGKGCRKCTLNHEGREKRFIDSVNKLHGDRFDVSKAVYINQNSPIEVVCKMHGPFWAEPRSVVRGHGCRACSETVWWTKDIFLSKLPEKHRRRYDYSKVAEIKHSKQKVVIICPEHGEFRQTPKSHVGGCGCPVCAKSMVGHGRSMFQEACDRNNNGFGALYVIKCFSDKESFYKIGITSTAISIRFSGKRAMPYKYHIVLEHRDMGGVVFDLEKSLHKILGKNKCKPDLFFEGHTECFTNIKAVEPLLRKLTSSKQMQLIT